MAKDDFAPQIDRRQRRLFDKDVLRPGVWWLGGTRWDATLGVLRRLVINHQQARARGIRIPIVWNHSADARDKIGEVIRLYLSGETLRARFWIAGEENIRRLTQSQPEMSVEVAEPWIDGQGRAYDHFVTHLAVVQHPVVDHQGPVYQLRLNQLSLLSANLKGDPSMADTLDAPASTLEMIDVPRIVRAVNAIIDLLGSSHRLDEETSPEKLADQLEFLRDQIDALVQADASTDVASVVHRASLEQQVESLTQQLSLERQRQDRHQEDLFVRALDALIEEGRLLPADRASLLEAAAPTRYCLSLLAPYQQLPRSHAVPVKGVSRRSAKAEGPSLAEAPPMTDQRARDIARRYTA